MKKILAAILMFAASGAAHAQVSGTGNGFHVVRNQTPLSVDSSGETSTLTNPSPSVLVTNVGSKTAYCQPGAATTFSPAISGGGQQQFDLSGVATLACITVGADTTTVNISQGYGLALGGGGGGSGGGGGGGSVTISGPLGGLNVLDSAGVSSSLTGTVYTGFTTPCTGALGDVGLLSCLLFETQQPMPAGSQIQPIAGTTGGATTYTTISATTAGGVVHSIKSSAAGTFYGFKWSSQASAGMSVRFYDAATLAACNSATGLLDQTWAPPAFTATPTTVGTAPGGAFSEGTGVGVAFTSGLGVCITGADASNDATAAVVGLDLTVFYK